MRRAAERPAPASALAAFAALALVGAGVLLVPRAVSPAPPTRPALCAVAVDLSASAARRRPGYASWLRRALRGVASAARDRGEDLAVVGYAREVRRLFGPGPAAGLVAELEGRGGGALELHARGGADAASDLEGALALLAADLADPERARGRVILISDGTSTGPDPSAALAEVAREVEGELEWIALPPATLADAALTGLVVPRALERGVPVVARVELALALPPGAPRSERLLVASLEGAGGRVREERVLRPPAIGPAIGDSDAGASGDGWLRWSEHVSLEPPAAGLYDLRVRVAAAEADPVPENDELTARVRIGETIVAAIVGEPAAREALARLLDGRAFAGIDRLPCDPLGLGVVLGEVDVVVSAGVGPADLPGPALGRFVRAGGGWLALADWAFLRGWSAERSVPADHAARLLPLLPPDTSERGREVVLLVDGSGSMAGEPFEHVRAAVAELVLAADPRDRLVLRFFTGSLGEVVLASEGDDPDDRREALLALFAARVPRGPTDVLYSLRRLAEERRDSERDGLALLLTDGRTRLWQPETSRAVRAELASTRTDLRVLAVGPRPDLAFLESLLLEGEQCVRAGDLRELTPLLQREVQARRVREGSFVALAAREARGLAADIVAAQLASDAARGAGGSLGAVERYVASRVAPAAWPLWTTADGAPLAALQPVGGGLVACLATTPLGDWSSGLGEHPGLLGPLVRALGRRGGERREPRLELEEHATRLAVASPAFPPCVEARVFARERGSGGLAGSFDERFLGSLELGVPRVAAGDPEHERTGPAAAFLDRVPPSTLLRVEIRPVGGGAERALAELFVPAPRPAEFAAGGRAVVRPSAGGASRAGERRSPAPRPLPGGRALLLAGLLALALSFVPGIGTRSLRYDSRAGARQGKGGSGR